jgi:uncharacterized membrane protein
VKQVVNVWRLNMSLQPLMDASIAIQFHVACALSAFLLGSVVVLKKKGGPTHRLLGRLWAVLMLSVALSSFFITGMKVIGPFGPIHLLSVYTIFGLAKGVLAARRRDIVAHRGFMISTYVGALLIAGAFTLMPGRRMHEVVFGPNAGLTPSLVVVAFAFIVSGAIMLKLVKWPARKALRGRPLPEKNRPPTLRPEPPCPSSRRRALRQCR